LRLGRGGRCGHLRPPSHSSSPAGTDGHSKASAAKSSTNPITDRNSTGHLNICSAITHPGRNPSAHAPGHYSGCSVCDQVARNYSDAICHIASNGCHHANGRAGVSPGTIIAYRHVLANANDRTDVDAAPHVNALANRNTSTNINDGANVDATANRNAVVNFDHGAIVGVSR
jgi:hypothetical protein